MLVHGTREDAESVREEGADVLAPVGLRLSPAKTQVVHMSDGFDFLGFRIRWRRKRGTDKWYVYTFISDRPIRSLKDKVRAMTGRTSQLPPRDVLIRLNQIMRGWANYFRHAVCKHTLDALDNFVWHRVIRWQMKLHRWNWKDVRRRHTGPNGRWLRPATDGIELFSLASVRSPGTSTGAARSPTPGQCQTTPNGRNRGEPAARRRARRVRRAAWGNGPRAIRHRAPGRLNQPGPGSRGGLDSRSAEVTRKSWLAELSF
ncbi:group II intron maturase-specific domain-containing protein [Trebonia kvetii]|uniref:group II intron maturase-specific domain-containing protein n=1 Tax=Trebonia kvetii TaxID=2480626 RepID=UPI001C9E7DEB|nr:group II intron maturase-specific domain-containing protein [Trebonia kvetii]